MAAWTPHRPDATIAAALFLALVIPIAFVNDPGWPYLVVGTVMYGALIFRRVHPVTSFGVVALAGFAQWLAELEVSINDFGCC